MAKPKLCGIAANKNNRAYGKCEARWIKQQTTKKQKGDLKC